MLTLDNILQTQEMGEKGRQKILDSILDDTFDASKDPISAIIVNAFNNNNKPTSDKPDFDMMETDLDYAINQLTKAKIKIRDHVNSNR